MHVGNPSDVYLTWMQSVIKSNPQLHKLSVFIPVWHEPRAEIPKPFFFFFGKQVRYYPRIVLVDRVKQCMFFSNKHKTGISEGYCWVVWFEIL